MAENITIGTVENFDELINGETPVFADFWASWCGPCRMLMPTVEALASEYEGKVRFVKVNVDEQPDLASRYGISSIPCLILFKAGQNLDKVVGARPKAALVKFIQQAL